MYHGIVRALLIIACAAGGLITHAGASELRLAAAYSAAESGVIEALVERFRLRHPEITVRLEGSGGIEALNKGRRGLADVVITHHPPSEKLFIADGFGLSRTLIMYNEFTLLGPPSDPLQLSRQRDLVEVMRRLADQEVEFFVPGSMSGTRRKLTELWTIAQIETGWPGFESTGASSRSTLLVAAEFGTYAFADMATYMSVRLQVQETLIPLYRDHTSLRNFYSYVLVNPDKVAGVNRVAAELFREFVISQEGQETIRHFGEEIYNSPIFSPAAYLDDGLRAERDARELRRQQRLLYSVSVAAVVLAVLMVAVLGLYRRTRELEQVRRLNEERFELAVAGTNDGIWDWNLRNGSLYMSPCMRSILGLTGAASDVPHPLRVFSPIMDADEHARLVRLMDSYLEGSDSEFFDVEFPVKWRRSDRIWVRLRGKALRDGQDAPLRMAGSLTDVTQLREQQAALEYQALHDGLTGLPNRVLLSDRLADAIAHARERHAGFALLMMDLDRFKEINDTLGHHVGDELLKQITARLCKLLRESDTVARLGGDEFAIIVSCATPERVNHVAEKIRLAVLRPFNLGSHSVVVDASLGIALFPAHGKDTKELLQHADVAMYQAKRASESIVVYDECEDPNSVRRLSLERGLREAIKTDSLELYFQPQVDLRRKTVVGVEALIRWTHVEEGPVPPDELIPLAEQTGLIRPLTLWVIQAALRQSVAWKQQGVTLPISVNLSVWNLQDPQLYSQIRQRVAEYGVSPSQIEFEVTESAMMANPDQVLRTLETLSSAGFRLAVDDFGTGFSSLGYLKKLPVQLLKIDRSFVRDMCVSESDHSIVRSTIELAHNLGLRVIAEGVEDVETLSALADLGADVAQGYYMSRPVPAEALLKWLYESPWSFAPASRPDRVVAAVGSRINLH